MYIGPHNIKDRALYLTGNQTLSDATINPPLAILRSDTNHKSRLSHVNVFLSHYFNSIKNSGGAGSEREDRLETVITK